jgi:uncharacterized repeat protein (TIGR01451 family)
MALIKIAVFSGRSDMTKWIRAATAVAIAVCGWNAQAQKAGTDVETRLEARKVVAAADGKETFAPADQARPGDVIEYVATYRNTTRQPVRNLDGTLPIPQQTEFLPGSQKPAQAEASLDGRTYAPMPLTRKVQRNGATVDEAVPARDYRFLRWHADVLGAEKSVAFTARVRVIDDRTTGPPPARGGGQ